MAQRPFAPLAALACLVACDAFVATAAAQSIAVVTPTDATGGAPAAGGGNFFATEGAAVPGNYELGLGVSASYGFAPLRVEDVCPLAESPCSASPASIDVVTGVAELHVYGVLAMAQRAQISLDLPVVVLGGQTFDYSNAAGEINLRGGTATNLGDPSLTAKVRLFGAPEASLHVGLAAGLSLPLAGLIADDDQVNAFGGHVGPTASVRALLSKSWSHLRIAASVGTTLRERTVLFDHVSRSRLTYRAAVGYAVRGRTSVFAELDGASDLDAGVDGNPLEVRAAVQLTPHHYTVTAGLGVGAVRGDGVPAARLFVAFAYAPHEAVSDVDDDDVLHRDDHCPDHAEDVDGHEDDDGCPDHDDDADGIRDRDDLCPRAAEDRDGQRDEDGCPDPDTDGDGIDDDYDSCVRQPEDRDGVRDTDGCPD